MHALVYIRRSDSFNKSVLDYAEKYIQPTRLTTISEYFNGDIRIDMNTSHKDYSWVTQRFVEQELDLSKVIFRDRLLRNIPFSDALILIRRAAGNLLEIMDKNSFDALVTYPVDNYIMDIMIQIANKKAIPCYGVCNFFMPDYKRLTIYGEHTPFRSPEQSEVEGVLKILQGKFRSHMAPNRAKALKAAIVRYIRYKARYPLFHLLAHKIFKRNEYDLSCTPYITTVRSFLNFFVERHFTSVEAIDFNKKSILVPLHYFPEATIEYWCGKSTQIEFEDMLLCKIDELSERYEQIVLKEHPATLFDNSSSFYKRLKENRKVVLIDPFVSTNQLLDHIDVLGCWTGTAGIEALVNGKQVELFTEEQYYRQAMNLHPDIIQKDGKKISIRDPYTFVEEILKGCIQR
jgi:hypothetical protein